jgi:predicted CoA-substrate-specific enzyme activase
MITAGCDVGSMTAKAVIMRDNSIIGSAVALTGPVSEKAAIEVMERALQKAGFSMDDIICCVGTGYGRKNIPFVTFRESEIACHAKGAVWQAPTVRTVIDIGGQDAKAVKVDSDGKVLRYLYNDKCASGTGRFLEIIAEALDIDLAEMGDLAKRATEKLTLSNQCVIFAETEIISLVNEGKEIPDIINALHHAVANRAASMAKSIVVEPDVAMTGGVAKNAGMFDALGSALDTELVKIEHPQINGAIGAALLARESCGADQDKEADGSPARS